MNTNHQIEVYGNTHQIKEDSPRIFVKEWKSQWATLKTGDEYVDESYAGSQFVVDDEWHTARIPMNIRLTGRTLNRDITHSGDYTPFVRCEIEIVKDGEPSEFIRGFVEVEMALYAN